MFFSEQEEGSRHDANGRIFLLLISLFCFTTFFSCFGPLLCHGRCERSVGDVSRNFWRDLESIFMGVGRGRRIFDERVNFITFPPFFYLYLAVTLFLRKILWEGRVNFLVESKIYYYRCIRSVRGGSRWQSSMKFHYCFFLFYFCLAVILSL